MSSFSFGPVAQPVQSKIAIAQAGAPMMGVQLYNVTCIRGQCELFDEIRGCCSFKATKKETEAHG